MEKDWVTIYEGEQRYQADLMKKHLDDVGIVSVVFDDQVSLYVGIVSPNFPNDTIKLKVRKEDEERAVEILAQYNE